MNTLPSDTITNADEAIICSKCGCSSTLREYFTDKSTAPLCPKCTAKSRKKKNAGYLAFAAVAILVLWASLIIGGNGSQTMNEIIFVTLNLVAILLPIALSLNFLLGAIIETITAQVVGAKVAALIIGQEPLHKNAYWGSTRISIGSLPYISYNLWAFLDDHAIIARMFITKLVNLFLPTIVITALLPNARLSNLWNTFAWREILIGTLLLYMILIAIYLISLPLSPKALWKEHYQRQITFALEKQNFADALTYAKAAHERFPEDGILRNLYAYSLLMSHQHDEAIRQFQLSLELILNQAGNGELKAMAHNNLGWAALTQSDKPEFQEVAKHHTERAFQMAPWLPHVRGTYAGLMLEEGNYEKALELAQQVAEERIRANNPQHDFSTAENLATCAIAYHYLGDPAKAKAHLEAAREYATAGLMIEKAQKLIAI